jgi:hypothetical protein
MADPVTLAMVGAAAGAALKPKDPLKGAMLGATVGFTGGTALGAGAAGAAGTGAAGGLAGGTGLTASGTGIGLSGSGAGLVAPASMPGLGVTSGASGLGVAAPTSFAGVGLTPSAMSAPTFAQQLSGAGSYMKENPFQTIQAAQGVQGLLTPEQMQQAPQAQIQRGQPLPPVNFASLLNPQQYKPQPISLLG